MRATTFKTELHISEEYIPRSSFLSVVFSILHSKAWQPNDAGPDNPKTVLHYHTDLCPGCIQHEPTAEIKIEASLVMVLKRPALFLPVPKLPPPVKAYPTLPAAMIASVTYSPKIDLLQEEDPHYCHQPLANDLQTIPVTGLHSRSYSFLFASHRGFQKNLALTCAYRAH